MAIRQNLWPSRRAKTTQCLPCLSETAHNRAPNARFMTERDKQELHSFCEGSPVLSEEVPARLPCGFLMTEYRVVCSGCRSDIPMENAWVRRARHEYSQHSIETWDVRGLHELPDVDQYLRPVPVQRDIRHHHWPHLAQGPDIWRFSQSVA